MTDSSSTKKRKERSVGLVGKNLGSVTGISQVGGERTSRAFLKGEVITSIDPSLTYKNAIIRLPQGSSVNAIGCVIEGRSISVSGRGNYVSGTAVSLSGSGHIAIITGGSVSGAGHKVAATGVSISGSGHKVSGDQIDSVSGAGHVVTAVRVGSLSGAGNRASCSNRPSVSGVNNNFSNTSAQDAKNVYEVCKASYAADIADRRKELLDVVPEELKSDRHVNQIFTENGSVVVRSFGPGQSTNFFGGGFSMPGFSFGNASFGSVTVVGDDNHAQDDSSSSSSISSVASISSISSISSEEADPALKRAKKESKKEYKKEQARRGTVPRKSNADKRIVKKKVKKTKKPSASSTPPPRPRFPADWKQDPIKLKNNEDGCTICCEFKCDAMAMRCGHLYMCMACAKKTAAADDSVCSICRTKIEYIQGVRLAS